MDICTDKNKLFEYLNRQRDLHVYSIGDLDEPFWTDTTYFTDIEGGRITALVVRYQTGDLPIIMALGEPTADMTRILTELIPTLGPRVYAHISYGMEPLFLEHYRCTYHETQIRMIQTESVTPPVSPTKRLWLDETQTKRVSDFYQRCYPENWFDPNMLSVHPFAGLERDGELVSVAGIHTLSRTFGSAALGSIATDPNYRGQGLAVNATALLCEKLRESVGHIGLNVHSQNAAAINCYRRVGFTTVAEFSEMMLEL